MAFLRALLPAILFAVAATAAAHRPLHILQLESYQLDGYARALKRQSDAWKDGLYAALAMLAISVALQLCFPSLPAMPWGYAPHGGSVGIIGGADGPTMVFVTPVAWLPWLGLAAPLLQAVAAVFIVWLRNRKKAKKPLVYTKRVKRLMGILFAVNLCVCVALRLLIIPGIPIPAMLAAMCLLCLVPAAQVLMLRLAALIAQPIEKRINMGFFRDAQKRLADRPDLIKIGVTGSYGKTSAKFILAAILAEKYDVLATPSSFNTPMGLTRVIREQLTAKHQVFIAEMGARHVGDIAELCELVHPSIGVLTSIGPQHLETFLTLENVANTKFELIAALPSGATAVVAEEVKRDWPQLIARRRDIAYIAAGMAEDCGVRASDIAVGPEGSDFSLALPGLEPMRMHTKLLGAHNIGNIALCCAVAHSLGMTGGQIARGVAKAEPVEHRLQLLRGAGGNVVIDDAFNSNPAGAKAALTVLAAFPGRKVIVTPGMVELGEREQELNRAFGAQIAKTADVAILIGRTRSVPIAQGLKEQGFAQENVYIAASLGEATQILTRIARPGDVTLFENDLPDNYEGQ